MKSKIILLGLLLSFGFSKLNAQGPPINTDKPIMVGAKTIIIKTLNKFEKHDHGDYLIIPIVFHYVPHKNVLLGLHVPFAKYSGDLIEDQKGFGDLRSYVKYQFFRKDGRAKTFRMAAKNVTVFPTGKNLADNDFGIKQWQSYTGAVIGYESIKYGIIGEFGFNWVDGGYSNELHQKLSFGLPLLKPVYPPKQINLYFEYHSRYNLDEKFWDIRYTQGIQYAMKKITFEVAFEMPILRKENDPNTFKRGVFWGLRYII